MMTKNYEDMAMHWNTTLDDYLAEPQITAALARTLVGDGEDEGFDAWGRGFDKFMKDNFYATLTKGLKLLLVK